MSPGKDMSRIEVYLGPAGSTRCRRVSHSSLSHRRSYDRTPFSWTDAKWAIGLSLHRGIYVF